MKIALHWKILFGLLLGVLWAYGATYFGLGEFTKNWIAPFGKIFINLLKLIALPLVLFSIIKGIGDLKEIKQLGLLGVKTMALYVGTTFFAISLGLVLVNSLKPGSGLDKDQLVVNRLSYEIWVNAHPSITKADDVNFLENPSYASFLSQAEKNLTQLESNATLQNKVSSASTVKENGPLQLLIDMIPSNLFAALSDNMLILQVIFFALFFGLTLLSIPKEKALFINNLTDALNDIFLKMVDLIMRAAPFFVFCLMAGTMSEIAGSNAGKMGDLLQTLLFYMVTVILGLAALIFGIYPGLVALLSKNISYLGFMKAMTKAQILAFSTSSSAATLPVTFECVNDNLKIPKRISSFVLPIGATVNMDGTSLYISVAVVFLAQMHMIDLDLSQQLTIVLTATLASIGASAVPSAGLIMMILVLQSVGLNPEWIAIIFPVDRILDMCRTAVNVTGDAFVATIVSGTENKNAIED